MFLLDQTFEVIAPHHCAICKAEGASLCEWCAMEVCAPLAPHCYRCHDLTVGSAVCDKCHTTSPLQHVWVATEYTGHAKQLIHEFKFQRAQSASVVIAQCMARALPLLDAGTLVMPVPTASSRRRQRGYDQAALLAKGVARHLGLFYAPLLRRMGQSRQVGADRGQRQVQLAEAFRLVKARLVVGADILLVDDIVTTGASLETTARVLKAAGARHINAVAFAQKQ